MKYLRRFTDWLDDEKTQSMFWYVVIAVSSAPIMLVIAIVLLDDVQRILLGAAVSLVSSFIIMWVVHKRDIRVIEKDIEKRLENGLPVLFEFDSSESFDLWFHSFIFGLEIGFVIFLVYMFVVFAIFLNRFPEL